MRIAQVCIDRPVLASVMSLVIALFGVISLTRLQNREYPDIDPPVVSVTTVFPGAAAEVVETSVTDPIEDQVNGIEGVKHVISRSREQVSQVTIEFSLSRDLEAAANDVRDRVARARRDLPEEVEDPVVAKQDADSRPVVWLALSGESYDQVQLTSLAERQIVDRLAKTPGVATVIVGGERRYSMRVWIDNRRLAAHDMTISEVAAALRRENVDVPSGRLESEDAEFTVRSLGELRSAQDFDAMILKTVNGELVRLRDVARVEVGPEDVRKLVRFNGVSAIGLGVVKQSTANTLDVAEAVKAEVAEIAPELPPGVNMEIGFDGSKFIRESIGDVSRTIFEAALLVVLVIYVFLRSMRATLIPAVAIPVSILGAFCVLYALGFTLNTLTLMGVTLAIGLVVDDAIVVLENISRWVESGTPPLEAARKGMQEISFAVVAATVSAVAVFLPLTFLTDETGRLFREFAVTVAAALAVSGFVAVTLSPALCALVVRRQPTERGVKGALARFIERISAGYAAMLRPVLRVPGLFVAFGAAWLVLGVFLLQEIPDELVPRSDRGVAFVWTQAPEGSTIEYMDRYQRGAEEVLLGRSEVDRVFSIVALGLGTPGLVNEGLVIAPLVDRDQRELAGYDLVDEVRPPLGRIPGIKAYPSAPSMLTGFMSSPVSFVIAGGDDLFELKALSEEFEQRIKEHPGFDHVQTNLYLNKPQLEVAIDRERANDLNLSVRELAETLQILLGGLDLSTFKLGGETYNVMVQLERRERKTPRNVLELYVRGSDRELISLAAVVDTRETSSPREIPHYDRQRSVEVTADLMQGFTQGEGLDVVRSIAEEVLPEGYHLRFTGEAEKFLESGNALVFAYGLAILVVFLVLSAQFESFVHPLTILVAVAFSFTGALLALYAVYWMNQWDWVNLSGTLNLFSKIGLVMLIGLVTKNSILIVEFANQLRDRGLALEEAIFEAARTRFRPILMTALATMVGILPIALGRGAGGDSRAPLGIAVVGGMFFSTLLTFFIVPATYLVVARLQARLGRSAGARQRGEPATVAGA